MEDRRRAIRSHLAAAALRRPIPTASRDRIVLQCFVLDADHPLNMPRLGFRVDIDEKGPRH